MKRRITIAKSSGFCLGVQRAVEMALESAKKYGEVQMLGEIVHNETVIEILKNAGVRIVKSLDEVDSAKPVLFRSHGTPKGIRETARRSGLKVIDATCPLIIHIRKVAQKLEADGRTVIVIGDKGHDEVTAIVSDLANSIVVSNIQDAESLPRIRKAGAVAQSTQDIEQVGKIMSKIVEKVEDLRFINTICNPTRDRQRQVIKLASSNDIMLIIGSRTSANTKRLAAIASAINPKTFLIQNVDELNPDWFEKARTIGISSGASTPAESIEEVKKKIARFSS